MSRTHTTPAIGVLTVFVAIAGCTGFPVGPFGASVDDEPWTESVAVEVEYVVDGDTVIVSFPDGEEATVRLVGVDAPESGDTNPREYAAIPATPGGRSCLRYWARHARATIRNAVSGSSVQLAFDSRSDRRGHYDRLLGYLIANDTTLNRRLVAEGFARFYDTEFEARDTYADLEDDARAADRGVWSCRRTTQ